MLGVLKNEKEEREWNKGSYGVKILGLICLFMVGLVFEKGVIIEGFMRFFE